MAEERGSIYSRIEVVGYICKVLLTLISWGASPVILTSSLSLCVWFCVYLYFIFFPATREHAKKGRTAAVPTLPTHFHRPFPS